MRSSRQDWLTASIHIRKAHEDAIRLVTLSAHDVNADGYERLALRSLEVALAAVGFKVVKWDGRAPAGPADELGFVPEPPDNMRDA